MRGWHLRTYHVHPFGAIAGCGWTHGGAKTCAFGLFHRKQVHGDHARRARRSTSVRHHQGREVPQEGHSAIRDLACHLPQDRHQGLHC